MKKQRLWALAALCALALSGCNYMGSTAVEDLLRAPQFSGQLNQIHKALSAYLGEAPQLKYPTGGDHLSPFVLGDWDGNGTDDAAVFYTSASKGPNVQLAILEQLDTGWKVTQEKEGLSTEVESVNVATLDGREAVGSQLVVGYGTTQGDRYLSVYTYADVTLTAVMEAAYSEYLLADITGSGSQDLVIVRPGASGIELELLTSVEESYQQIQSLQLSQGRFTGCAGLYSSIGRGGHHYLVVDGYTGNNDAYLASEILYYDRLDQELESYRSDFEEDIYNATLRYFTSLHSMDVDDDGTVEIPVQLTGDDGGVINPSLDRRLGFVTWQDYTSSDRPQSYGVVDAEYGFYLELPTSWRGQVELTPGEADNSWEVRSPDGEELYLSVRIVSVGAPAREDYRRVALLGNQQIQLKVTAKGREMGFGSGSGKTIVL